MAKRFLFLAPFLLTCITGVGQINRQDADSMILSLKKNTQGIYRIELLLHLAQFHIFKPGERETDFDSAVVYINEAKALNKSVKSSTINGLHLLTESFLTKERGKRDDGKKMVEQAITILESGNNKNYLGQAYYELSTYYDYADSMQCIQKIDLVEKAIIAFEQSGNLKRKGIALEMLGDLYSETNNNDRAIVVLKQGLAAYDSINHPHLQGIYVLLGAVYMEKQQYGQALFYDLQALKTAQGLNDSSMQLCQIFNQLGRLYQDIGRIDLALTYQYKALEVAQRNRDENSVFLLASNMASAYDEINQPEQVLKVLALVPKQYKGSDGSYDKFVRNLCYARAYMQLGKFNIAKPHCDTVLQIAEEKLVPEQRRSNGYRLVAMYYFRTKRYTQARHYLKKSMEILKSLNFEYARIQGFRLAYQLDSAQGNFSSAYKYLSLYKAKTDSVFSERTARQFQVMIVEYEVGMKEDSIKLKDQNIALLTQRNSLLQAPLRQQSLIKNITGGGIIVAFIIIALLYRQYMQKQKNNKLITHKNEQLQHYLTEKDWLLKEIHHRVKNNFQMVMGLLGTQSRYLKSEEAVNAVNDSQHRIQSMSLIHQKLYQSNNLSAINLSDYIHELVDSLSESFNTNNHIRFYFEVEAVELDIAHCIPLGLIMNEAITNSFKYAFPNNTAGTISVLFKSHLVNQFQLSIEDNGKGLPSSFEINQSGSMGMNLMRGLSKEIGAQFKIVSQNGTKITVSFEYDREMTNEILPVTAIKPRQHETESSYR